MYRYRDYVINAFNQNKPYDQFVKEQLAGDELAPGNQDVDGRDRFSGELPRQSQFPRSDRPEIPDHH